MTKWQEDGLAQDIHRMTNALERIASAVDKPDNRKVEEIVRCEDCKHWNFQDICGVISNEKAVLRTGFDFYCGYGERKEDD